MNVTRLVQRCSKGLVSSYKICGVPSRKLAADTSRATFIAFENVTTETRGEKKNVGLITLNSPKTLNALCNKLMQEVDDAVGQFDRDPSIACLILTGKGRAFAAGADIKEMLPLTYQDTYKNNFLSDWNGLSRCRKPVIAAVNGFALGGGCEIAMMCDIVYASERAKFGQPEIKLGTLPGAGGTQRLTKAIGKSRAMELMLTGEMIDAEEAARIGLVSKVFSDEELITECIRLAEKIGEQSKLATMMVKEAVNKSFEVGLSEGLSYEKKLFHSSFAFNDRAEGMAAFAEKRPANFTDS